MSTQGCPKCGYPRPTIRKPANLRQAALGGWTCPSCRTEFDSFSRRVSPGPRADASDPGGLTASDAKLRVLRPDLYGFQGFRRKVREAVGLDWKQREYIDEHLLNGDSRAALVVSTAPLLVAAYTDELDCVAIVGYPDEFVEEYGLREGSGLLTINTYFRHIQPDVDLVPGPKSTGNWTGFHPMIAEFVSDDSARIEQRKAEIPDQEWRRAHRMGKAYLKERPGFARDGRPPYSGMDAPGRSGRLSAARDSLARREGPLGRAHAEGLDADPLLVGPLLEPLVVGPL